MRAAAWAATIRAADPARLRVLGLQSAPPARCSPLPFSNRKFQRLEPKLTPRKQTTALRSNRQKMHGSHAAIYRFLPLARHGRIAAL
jgi:hypothetical protein